MALWRSRVRPAIHPTLSKIHGRVHVQASDEPGGLVRGGLTLIANLSVCFCYLVFQRHDELPANPEEII